MPHWVGLLLLCIKKTDLLLIGAIGGVICIDFARDLVEEKDVSSKKVWGDRKSTRLNSSH